MKDSISLINKPTDDTNKATSKYAFKIQQKKGDRYYYTISNNTQTQVDYKTQKVNNIITSTVGLLYEVIADTANKYLIKITYKKLHTLTQNGDTKEEMDADNEDSYNPNEKVLAGIKDQSIYLTTNKNWRLLSVTGYNEIASHALSEVQISDETQKNNLQKQLTNLLGESFIKANLSEERTLFPNKTLQEGDTWERTTTQDIPFPVIGTSHYEVERIDEDGVQLSSSTALKSSDKSTTVMGVQAVANVEGKSKAEYFLQPSTGMITKEKTTTHLEGTLQVMGRDVPITLDVERKVDVKKM